jgi:hypothetical protein
MVLPYRKWSDEDILNRNVVPKGDYRFKIEKALLTKTKGGQDKAGNPKPIHDMLEIDFIYFDENGVVRRIRDWIVFSDGMDWKLRHLAKTVDLIDIYDSQSLEASHLMNKEGVFELGIRDYTDKYFQTRKTNFVMDYVQKTLPGKAAPANENFLSDDIPF